MFLPWPPACFLSSSLLDRWTVRKLGGATEVGTIFISQTPSILDLPSLSLFLSPLSLSSNTHTCKNTRPPVTSWLLQFIVLTTCSVHLHTPHALAMTGVCETKRERGRESRTLKRSDHLPHQVMFVQGKLSLFLVLSFPLTSRHTHPTLAYTLYVCVYVPCMF